MALWGLAWLGSTPIGGSIVGWIGQDAGARWSLVVGGLNPPGESGDSICWESVRHGTSSEELPA
jgi:hypothetical protein